MDRVDYQPLIIQDLVNLKHREELNLRPWYQRRIVWTSPQQAYLINTIHENKPIPSIYIRHEIDESGKSVREVVDGQQRLAAILAYVDGEFAARHPAHKSPVKFSELNNKQRRAFLTTGLAVGYLLGADDADVIEIFGRINSVSKKLSPQEKRNSRFDGEFKQFVLRQASQRVAFWRGRGIFTALQIARMLETQFVSELVMNMTEGLQDYSPERIDAFYKKNDLKFSGERAITRRLDAVFDLLVSLPVSALKDTLFRRPPILFSLMIILDGKRRPPNPVRLEEAMHEVDDIFETDEDYKATADTRFFVACTSNPHRIRSREIRDRYIRRFVR